MADMLAAVANQNTRLQNLLINETESGSANKVPRLMELSDYTHWKGRFETHLNGTDTNLWERILTPYERPKIANTGLDQTLDRFTDEQRKEYDSEKKAYWMLSQAIPRDIYHQFSEHQTSYGLWRALEARVEGNRKLKQMKATDIRKEFENFNHIGNESLDALITRFHHLLAELRKYGIEYSEDEKIDCMADALPSKWGSLVMILRENLPGMKLSEFIQKLEEMELKEQRKARRVNVVQDPSLYGASVVTPPPTGSKLQTAFVTKTSNENSSNASSSEFTASSNSSSESKNET